MRIASAIPAPLERPCGRGTPILGGRPARQGFRGHQAGAALPALPPPALPLPAMPLPAMPLPALFVLALFVLALFVPAPARAQAPVRTAVRTPDHAASLLGAWMTEDRQGVIRIEPCGDAFCGRVVGISDFPPGGLRDVHGAPQCQLVIIHGLRPTEDGRRAGTITNPDDGRTYSALTWVGPDGVLRLRGYVGLPLLGSTQHWPRFSGRLTADCHFTP